MKLGNMQEKGPQPSPTNILCIHVANAKCYRNF